VRDNISLHQDPAYDDLLRVYTSSREKEQAREMAKRARNPRETRESPEKSTGGTAVNVYKEM
jgi:hypothetical protein